MKKIWTLALLPAVGLSLAACRVEKTADGELPEVEVEGGKLPEYDVDPPRIEIGRDTKTVVVPSVKIKTRPDTIKPVTTKR
ncbi:MAG: hypothetical protein ACREMA_05000 [Longimicrobiales bacterium]